MKPIGPSGIIDKKKDFLFPCSHHFYKEPPQITKANMQYLYDNENNEYLDFFAGVSVMNCGHCNPDIINPIIAQMQTLQHTTTIYLTQPIVDLAEKLASILPGEINKSFFCCTGSEANEGALLLAKLYTKKNKFIAFHGGLHGRTHLTTSATGIDMWKSDPFPNEDFEFVPNIDYYLDYSQPVNEIAIEKAAKRTIKDLICLVKGPSGDSISAMIVEPIQGNGGIITPPLWYFKVIKEILNEKNILFIADEVQTGFGRTGKMFAIEHYGINPDIITTAKALGNGMPISAFSTTNIIAEAFNKPSASTLGGNPVSSVAALAVLDYIEEKQLIDRAQKLGKILYKELEKIKFDFPFIKDHRGVGLMQGLYVDAINEMSPSEVTDIILEKLKDKRILLGKNGLARNVLAFQPPLIINEDDIHMLISNLRKILKEMHSS